MKPRRESAVLTREDTKIWLNINLPMRRKAPHPQPSRAYFESDRRDAALMLEAQRCRYRTFPVDMPPLELIGAGGVLVCGGAIFLPANPYPAGAMKSLPSAPPTLEDSDIWLSIVVGYGLDWATAGVIFRDADRRDAELMLRVVTVRGYYEELRTWVRAAAGWAPLGAHSIMIGAQTRGIDPADAFNITGCA